MNKPNARTYGGITVAHFGGSGDIRTNLTSAELTDLEILVGDFDVKTALVMGAELEPLTIALHYISGARATAGVGAFGSWHDPYGPRSLARPGAFWSLLPRMSPGARYLLRRITPKDISAKIGTAQLESPDIVARVTAIPSYDVAVLSYEASLRLPDATSPISRITLGRSWVTIELATSEV